MIICAVLPRHISISINKKGFSLVSKGVAILEFEQRISAATATLIMMTAGVAGVLI
jgi:hypothetical protein